MKKKELNEISFSPKVVETLLWLQTGSVDMDDNTHVVNGGINECMNYLKEVSNFVIDNYYKVGYEPETNLALVSILESIRMIEIKLESLKQPLNQCL